MKKEKFWLRYLIFFLVFSVLGSLIEFGFSSLFGNPIGYDKTILRFFGIRLYLIPFYGLVGISLLFIQRFMEKKKIKIIYRGLINGAIIILFELIVGLISISLFNWNAWNYSEHFLNFKGIISLPMSLVWIGLGYSFSFLYKFLKKPLKLKS